MSNEQSTEDETETTDFAVMLAQLAKGKSNTQLSEELRAVVAGVAKTHKNGKLTVTIHVKPQPKVAGAVIVSAVSKATVPVFEQAAEILYATNDGDLVRDDPQQHRLY
ncbi:hypothetical protein ACFORH_42750 [Amycolatopsis roodepoortensis]|uniref:Uncharacterized protein n=1 Tax=Amycolatopsis roodepoortensis TaxID=700274 RepID=A0ABR9L4F6_9PSEU|nr:MULTISPECIES: hypothetical protein [Amycolatopsis]MBE1575036.1 hypothetical protein [Amycolatopsis roodepoortensis]GHG97371.1 hypothetical protein GCM10017788_76830 [Amycolatopsis acidiphila]